MSNEDWYSLLIDTETNTLSIEHEWSHKKSGELTFQSGRKIYNLEEFKQTNPNQYYELLKWLQKVLP